MRLLAGGLPDLGSRPELGARRARRSAGGAGARRQGAEAGLAGRGRLALPADPAWLALPQAHPMGVLPPRVCLRVEIPGDISVVLEQQERAGDRQCAAEPVGGA